MVIPSYFRLVSPATGRQARGVVGSVWLAVACAACSSGSTSPPASFPPSPFLSTTSESGALQVELRTSPQPPAQGLIDAQLVVTRISDGTPGDGLTLAIQPWMPAMNHGSVPPSVTAQETGKYLVTNLDLYMAGRWQLRTNVSGVMTDHVTPDFSIP
jgi:hypothetical protein